VNTGEVVAVGPTVRNIEPGDRVLFSPDAGFEVEIREGHAGVEGGPFAIVRHPVYLGLAILQLVLAAAHLFLRLAKLRRRGILCVALNRVGELRGSADEMQRVHPDGVSAGLDDGRTSCSLEHSELRLQLRRVAPEGVEGLANALGLVGAVAGLRQVLEPRERGQGRLR